MGKENLGQNPGKLNHALIKQICHETMDECFRLPVPLTWPEIIEKCKESINRKEKELNISPFSDAFSKRTFNNYVDELKKRSKIDLGIKLPLKTKSSGKVNDSPLTRDGRNKSKQRSLTAYYYTDKGFTLFPKPLDDIDRKKIQEIGAYLKNVSSRWQNDMLEDITQGLEILQLDLDTTQPKVQYELPYHLDEKQLQIFKLLYRAIDKQQVIEFEYDRHNAPGEDYFEGKSEEEIRKIRYKVVMSPYFLKQSLNRWYLLGKSHEEYLEYEDYLMPVSIERLKKIKIREDLVYQSNLGITLKDYYQNLIGISMERNQEKQSCCFVTTLENLEIIKKQKPKFNDTVSASNTKEQNLYKMIFWDFDPYDYQEKLLNIDLDFSSYDDKEHQLMEFKGDLNLELLNFIEKNPKDVRLIFPLQLQKGDFMFKNCRYLAIQISNHLLGKAISLHFELVKGPTSKEVLLEKIEAIINNLKRNENLKNKINEGQVSDSDDSLERLLNIGIDYSNYDRNRFKLMEFNGLVTDEIFNFINENPIDIKLIFPYSIEKWNTIFKNCRYLAVQISNQLYDEATKLEFNLITGISPKNELQRRFSKLSLDYVFGQNSKRNGFIAVKRLNLKVDTELIKLLSQPEIKRKVSLLTPKNLLRKTFSPNDVKDVILEVNKTFAHYVTSKPFHESQKSLEFVQVKQLVESNEKKFKWHQEENKDGVYFHLKLIPNKELENQVLSKGDQIKVIYPFDLKEKISKRVAKMYQLYHKAKQKATLILEVEKTFSQNLISQPLDRSQRIIDFAQIIGLLEKEEPRLKWNLLEKEDCVYFLFKLIPTNEFMERFKSMSDQVKILYPFNFLKQ